MSAGQEHVECPDWCTAHEVHDVTDDNGHTMESHRAWLFYKRAPLTTTGPPLLAFDLHEPCDFVYGDDVCRLLGPAISFYRGDDGPPHTLEPEEARELAAGLLRAAEAVEAARTALCPVCGRAVAPGWLDDGVCTRCSLDRHKTARADRRKALRVVES